MFKDIGFTRKQVESEIVRCHILSVSADCLCRDVYAKRAKDMTRAVTSVFWGRAYQDEIDRDAAILLRAMQSAPRIVAECTTEQFSNVWRVYNV